MHTEQLMERLRSHIRLVQQLAAHYTEATGTEVSELDIKYALLQLLGEKEDLRTVIDVSRLILTVDQARVLLDDFDFRQFNVSVLVDAQSFPEDLLPSIYATIKEGGKQWRIHLSDADDWPSKPHAHFYAGNLKLDLRNGDCYQGRQFKKALL
jgi:hypothetical protein